MSSDGMSVILEKLFQTGEENDALIAVCQNIAREVVLGLTDVHTIVKDLGPYLINEHIGIRANGVKSLALILENLPHDYLNESELQLLIAFHCDRLQDHHSIGPYTILGILAIVQMKNLPTDAAARIAHSIFQNIRCQSEVQHVRNNIYVILKILLENYFDNLKSMGPDFVYGIISTMDGECDPRNLMLLFSFFPSFMKKFPLGHLTEEMFEVVACYFPIDFNSDLIGEKKITRNDLAEALAPCLYAIPQFGEFCLPLAMEKLDSDRKVAKLDSLHLLIQGVSIFYGKNLTYHLNELWPMLKKEILSVSDQETRKLALEAISEIIKAIIDDEEIYNNFIEKIFTDTRPSLHHIQLSLYWPAEKVLEAVARADKNSCIRALHEVIPMCLSQYSIRTSNTDKVTLLKTLNNFIKISMDFNFSIGDFPEFAWTDIPGLYLKELDTQENTLKLEALSGLMIQKLSLKKGQRTRVCEKVCHLIDSDVDIDVRNMCQSVLFSISKLYPNEVIEILEKRLLIDIDNVTIAVLTRRLEAFSSLAKILEIGEVFLPRIVEIAVSNKNPLEILALRCLYRLLSLPNNDFDIHEYLYARWNVIDRLMRCQNNDIKKLSLLSGVCRLIVRSLRVEDQQAVTNKYNINDELTNSEVILFEGILTPLRKNVKIDQLEYLIEKFVKFALDKEICEATKSACRTIAMFVNKMDEDMNFERILNTLSQRINDVLKSENLTMGRKKGAITLHTWLTKSLVTRGSRNSKDFLDYQISLLRLDAIGSFVADEFKTLVDKSENILIEENFNTIKIFYKQRIFESVIQLNSDFDSGSRQNYLVALAHLVEEVPIELSFMHLEGLVPLLVESLSFDDGELLLSTLRTLKLLLETRHDIFVDQIQCFIPICLQLSTYKKMNVRIAALDCLLSYCKYPIIELLKYKQDVLEKLANPLDDHKRLVREIAVKARTRWYLVGAPGGSD